MKKLLCALLCAAITFGTLPVLSFSSLAASARVSLKKKSATLKISSENEKKIYGKTKIKLKKTDGVKIKKLSFKSSDKRIASVTKKGTVKAKKRGSAKITVNVKYKYKKRIYKKKLTFNIRVKDNSAYKSFLSRLSAFSNKLYNMSSDGVKDNYSMSPLSVYLALAMLYNASDSNVKSDIEALTGMSESDIARTAALFDKLNREYSYNGELVSKLSLTNSIWIDKNEPVKQDALKDFTDKLNCSAFETTFRDDNKAANEAIRKFVKDNTNGLIDRDFGLDPSTLLALINTLYLKDVWSNEISELNTEKREFKSESGTKKLEFLYALYEDGQTASTSTSEFFYATTNAGYKIKFILPKKGVSLSKAMSADNLNKINSTTDFKTEGTDGALHYTRCIFPGFKLESETPLVDIFQKNNALTNAFINFSSPLTDTPLCVSDIKHNVVLRVDKKGVEGAAVTIFALKCSSALDPQPKKYHDFVLDRPFGFIITDPDDIVLFEGQITNPQK